MKTGLIIRTLRRSVPQSIRKRVIFLRPLPSFIILGAMKAGTTTLHEHLIRHPKIAFGMRKELHYFNKHYPLGTGHYRSQFPFFRVPGCRIGDATPAYLFHPDVPGRIHELLPNVKLIALLRDPVERAISHYFHSLRNKTEPLPMEEAMWAEEERLAPFMQRRDSETVVPFLRYSYKLRGHYLEQIERYWNLFPRENLMIIRSEDFFANPLETLGQVCGFLGLERHRNWGDLSASNVGGNRREVPDELRAKLREYFAPHNRRLEEALGRKMDWD